MLFTLSTTHPPATDLGFVLAKNPTRLHTFELPSGVATVFFPDATPELCTAALLVEVDVVGAARSGRHADSEPLARCVNDRGYSASSLLSVALGRVYGTAMASPSRELVVGRYLRRRSGLVRGSPPSRPTVAAHREPADAGVGRAVRRPAWLGFRGRGEGRPVEETIRDLPVLFFLRITSGTRKEGVLGCSNQTMELLAMLVATNGTAEIAIPAGNCGPTTNVDKAHGWLEVRGLNGALQIKPGIQWRNTPALPGTTWAAVGSAATADGVTNPSTSWTTLSLAGFKYCRPVYLVSLASGATLATAAVSGVIETVGP